MSALAPDIVGTSNRNRSAKTNSSWKLDGVDSRTAAGRRYRDLCMAFADDLGGAAGLSTAQSTTVRQLAGVVVEVEKLQAQIVGFEELVNHEQLVRLSNLQSRLLRQLGIKGGPKAKDEPDLASYLAEASA